MDKIKPLVGLLGILVAAMASEFNDEVFSVALPDVLGASGISHDPGTWLDSLYVTAEIIGLALSPWFFITFSVRRFALFAIGLNGVVTVLIPFSPDASGLYVLRTLQGLAGGLTVPILLAAALKGLPLPVRLYGLAAYALTATFTPNFSAGLAALWVDVVDWRFVFLQAIPLFSVAAVLVWWGLPQDPPQYDRFRRFDWRGAIGLVVGIGALGTMLQQGDRLDWFNSDFVCVLALVSVVVLPLFLLNEWFHPLPFLKLQLLGRRNIAYAVLALFCFLLIGSTSSLLPTNYLSEVQGYRPIQLYGVTMLIALAQLVMLPAVAVLLNFEWADARVVSFAGLSLVLCASIGDSRIAISWDRSQFDPWEVLQAIGQPMVVMPLLMMATNAVRDPKAEGPFVSALVNSVRGLAEAVGTWLVELIRRWRGALHSDRLVDQFGQDRFRLARAHGLVPDRPPPLLPTGQPTAPHALERFGEAVGQQAAILTTADAFLVFAAVTVFLMAVLFVLPVRTPPPRLLAKPR